MLSGTSSATGGMIATFSAIGDNVNVVIDVCTTSHTQANKADSCFFLIMFSRCTANHKDTHQQTKYKQFDKVQKKVFKKLSLREPQKSVSPWHGQNLGHTFPLHPVHVFAPVFDQSDTFAVMQKGLSVALMERYADRQQFSLP